MPVFEFPRIDQRISIVGRTGSGKTQAGVFHLSESHYTKIPYVVVDYKRDELINSIPGHREIGLNEKIPKAPGIYLVHPIPDIDDDAVEKLMFRIWEKGDTGLYADEGYMIPDGPALRSILTQGRSLHIPTIINSQRPVWMSRFVFSESDFFQVFRLTHKKDIQNVNEFAPVGPVNLLPEYHSRYYNVKRQLTNTLKPVPDADTILNRFDVRQGRRTKFI